MAKSIKFNLVLGGHQVRTIENLQNHFEADEVLQYYEKGILRRWLLARGYGEQVSKLDAISSKDTESILIGLCNTFDMDVDEQEIKQCAADIRSSQEQMPVVSQGVLHQNETKIIQNHRESYLELMKILFSDTDDLNLIRSTVKTINDKYFYELLLGGEPLLERLWKKSTYTLLCFLMYNNTRALICEPENVADRVPYELRGSFTCDMWSRMRNYEYRGKAVKPVKIYGSSNWSTAIPAGQKILVLETPPGVSIRAAGQLEPTYTNEAVAEKLPVLDGLDYKTGYNSRQIWYLEV